MRRSLHLAAGGLRDQIEVENTSSERLALNLELEVEGDFSDLFETRGWDARPRSAQIVDVGDQCLEIRHTASDGVTQAVRLAFDAGARPRTGGAAWSLELEPRERAVVAVALDIVDPIDTMAPMPYETWRESFVGLPESPDARVLERAISDLRALLLFEPEGPVLAAGIPWFVAAFGRDMLLSAHMLLPYRPDVAEATLRFLAGRQGREIRPFQAEAPGKILHEVRYGELSRTGRVPHARYYGTVDATPLFLTLLGAHRRATADDRLVRELRPAWEAALGWLSDYGDIDGDGFFEFTPTPPTAPLPRGTRR